jgi:hypothetical protein
MDIQLALICFLTFVIHLMGTLAYSVRIAGVRTRRVAMSFALFNILVLVSRTSNGFQVPFMNKRVEQSAGNPHLLSDFRWFLFSATLATLLGAILIPTFQRVFSQALLRFQAHRSVPKLLMHALLGGGFASLRQFVSLPVSANLSGLRAGPSVSARVVTLNVLAMALWTVGVFAPAYAGFLNPELRLTSGGLSSLINGLATILMFIVIDPQISVMTDDVVEGKISESAFRRAIVWLVGGRFAGTILAQLLLIPAATLIVKVAERL